MSEALGMGGRDREADADASLSALKRRKDVPLVFSERSSEAPGGYAQSCKVAGATCR